MIVAKLTHFDAKGKARMVDVSAKAATARIAVAKGSVLMARATLALVLKGTAKKTSAFIPLCHPSGLSSVEVDLSCDKKRNAVDIVATCKVAGQTGVEMEALTAVSVAALTVYDMLKAVDRAMTITDVRLTHKSGGKSETFERP